MGRELKYDESSIQHYEGLQAIRKRPTMYIQELGPEGVRRLFIEVIGNSLDEYGAGYGKKVEIKITTGEIPTFRVRDYGRGIPPKKLEEVVSKIHSGGKFSKKSYNLSTGLNGVGLKAVNALSNEFVTITTREGYVYSIKYNKGEKVEDLKKEKSTQRSGTIVYFEPDETIFGDVTIDLNQYKELLQLYAYLNPDLEFILRIDDKEPISYLSKNGLLDLLKDYKHNSILKEPIKIKGHSEIEDKKKKASPDDENLIIMDLDILIDYDKTRDSEYITSFVNGVATIEDGTHVTGILMAMTQFFSNYIKERKLLPAKSKIEITGEDVRECMLLVVSAKHSDPLFVSQTKNKLSNQDILGFGKSLVLEELSKVDKKVLDTISNTIINTARGRMAARSAKIAAKKVKQSPIIGISKFDKYTSCLSKNPEECELYIVEGASASGGIVDGRNPDTQAIYRLRGKPRNAHDLTVDKMMQNAELSDISIILGTGLGKAFNYEKLNFNKIIIASDADSDGFHIACLLSDLFFTHARKLVEMGHVYLAKPPLYLIGKGKDKTFVSNKIDFASYIVDKVYSSHEIELNKEKLSKDELRDFIKENKNYLYMIKKESNKFALDETLFETICRKYNKDNLDYGEKVVEKFDEVKFIDNRYIEGIVNNRFQSVYLDNSEFIDSIKKIRKFYSKFKTSLIKLDGKSMSYKRFLEKINSLSIPKGEKLNRFKGLN